MKEKYLISAFKLFYLFLIFLWLYFIIYFIITEDWIRLIKNILIFTFSFISGRISSLIYRHPKIKEIDMNEFVHDFVKPLIKENYKLKLNKYMVKKIKNYCMIQIEKEKDKLLDNPENKRWIAGRIDAFEELLNNIKYWEN